jgi:iron complex outermembrane receptor protein
LPLLIKLYTLSGQLTTNEPQIMTTAFRDPSSTRIAAAMLVLVACASSPSAIGKTQNSGKLEEVLVTATKREQVLRDIPASISALSGAELEESGAQELADFLRQIPGITQNPLGTDQNRITIRGVGADTARLTTSQTTAIMIGETSFSDPMFSAVSPDVNPFDLSGVEVLKGPQGTLFGSSGLSGAIRYVPAKPQFGQWHFKLSGSLSETNEGDDSTSTSIALNAPVGGDYPLALRLVRVDRKVGGIIDDQRTGEEDIDSREQISQRVLLAWEPSDKLIIDAMYMKQESQADEMPFASDTQGKLIRSTTFGPSLQETAFDIANLTATYVTPYADVVLTVSRISKFLDQNLDATRLVNNASQTGQEIARIALLQDVEGDTQELRFVSNNDGPIKWIVGGFSLDYSQFFKSTLYNQSTSNLLPTGGNLLPPVVLSDITADLEAREIAVFADVSWAFIADWELGLGVRDYRSVVNGAVVGSGAVILAATGAPEYSNIERISESGMNPKASITWTPLEELMVYASVSKGFRMGGIQTITDTPTADVPPVFKSDTLWNYEIGARVSWLDDTLVTDMTVYQIDWDEPQMVQRTPDNLFNIINNVGSAKVEGAELVVRYLTPFDGLAINLSAAYTDAYTTENFNSPDGTPVPTGTPLPGTSLWQTATTLSYGFAIGHWNLDASLIHSFYSEAANDLKKSAEVLGYDSLDARISARRGWGERELSLTLAASNLGDERGIANVLYNAEDRQDVYYIRPRTIEFRFAINI